MIVDKHISFIRLFKIIWKQMLAYTILSAAIIVPIAYFELDALTIEMTTPLILGTALSIFLGFQTNSAYQRWTTARSYVGMIKQNIRNMASILTRRDGEEYINHKTGKPSALAEKTAKRMLRRMMAFAWAYDRQVKREPVMEGLEQYLEKEEFERLKESHNPAYDMLLESSRDFRVVKGEEQFYDGEHFEMVGIHRNLIQVLTASEGLRDTPFPTHYIFFSKVFIWLLIILMSLSLSKVEAFSYHSVILVVMIAWFFTMILGIGSYMDEPFVNNRNVVPTKANARSIEIDLLKSSFRDPDVPEPIRAVEGAIY